MAGLGDLFGRNGAVEQLLLWGVVNQVLQNLAQPALTALAQDVNHAHPEQALDPVTAAEAAARHMLTQAQATDEAARGGIDAQRFATLLDLHKVRIPPAGLAEAVLRSYLTEGQAEEQARPQGIDQSQLRVLKDLAGDAPGPQDAARALQRGIIGEHGRGAGAVSYEQAIAESRLHDKWGPMLRQLQHQLLSAPDAASAVVRNFLPSDQARNLAEKQGIDAATFQTMVHLSADAPGPLQLAEALRRGAIPAEGTGPGSTSFQQGIAEGRLADKWAPVIRDLAKLWPTPVDALDAQVKGQLSEQEGAALYERLGGDPQFHGWLLHSIGEGPTPLEAAVMNARGIIPEHGTGPASTSYDQAVRESRYRNKWTQAYRHLARYHVTAGEVITFLAHAAITRERAIQLLTALDMDPETIAAFINEAEITELSEFRGLTQQAVLDLYHAHLIDAGLATQILTTLHVTPRSAQLLLDYTDLRVATDYIKRAVTRIGTLFTSHKITAQTAAASLTDLGVPAASTEQILAEWEITAAASVRILTETQIVDAWYYQILDTADAVSELTAIGYTDYDAWVLLSLKAKGPLPGRPDRTAQPPQGAVRPGTT